MPLDNTNDYAETETVQIDIEQIKWALEHNSLFFIQFFLGEHLTCPVPDFHISIFDFMVSKQVDKLALAIPRGHAKTTLAKLAVVWYLLFTNYRFIVYVSNTADVAQAALRDIWAFLRSDNFKAVFGDLNVEIDRAGEGLFIFKMTDARGKEKRCILRALGSNQQVRGLNIDNERPELGVVDDLEDDDNTATPKLIAKLRKWVYGPFFKAFNRWKRKIIWLGNMLSNESLLKSHCDSADWHSMLFGCIKADGTPLWPDLWPMSEIKKDYREYQEANSIAKWFAEMMNQPIPEGGGLIKSDEINYKPAVNPGDCEHVFMTIDPAISKKAWSDWTGIAVHGYVDDHWQIVYAIKAKVDAIQMFFLILSIARDWNCHLWGIEGVAFQAVLEPFFKILMIENRVEGVEIVMLGAQNQKTERLAVWAGFIKSKTYALTAGDIVVTGQLLNYDPNKIKNDDDIIDACAHGPQMLKYHMALILKEFDALSQHLKPIVGAACAGV